MNQNSVWSVQGGGNEIDIPFINFNAEKQWFDSGFLFDVICFCEVFEHFTESPVRALLNINKMLITGGTLIMSTPNVNRLENVARMISGANIYDPYSGYGRYGRHNREYNKHELNQLLSLAGFRIEEMFTKNVHEERAKNFYPVKKIMPLIKKIPNRDLDLGQYIFIRATKVEDKEKVQAPEWLYRSMKSPEITLGERTGK